MVLIKNKNICPGCGRKTGIRWDLRQCIECKTRLFKPDDNWKAIKESWILSGWVFFALHSSGNFRGWVYQSHLDTPQPVLEVKAEKPSSSYNAKPRDPGASQAYTPDQLGMKRY